MNRLLCAWPPPEADRDCRQRKHLLHTSHNGWMETVWTRFSDYRFSKKVQLSRHRGPHRTKKKFSNAICLCLVRVCKVYCTCNSKNTVMFSCTLKGEVRTINDRKICERRSCMKNNGKSPTFKFVSGEERRPSEVQRVSRGRRLPGATHSSADLTWIRKSLENQAPELS